MTATAPVIAPAAMGRQILAGALASVASHVVLVGLGLITTPYLLGRLGSAAYGVLLTISLVSSHVLVLELGFGVATARQLALARGSDSPSQLRATLRTSFGVFLLLGLVAGAALWAAAPWLVTDVFEVPRSLVSSARTAFRVAAPLIALALPLSFFSAALQGLGHLGPLNLSRTLFGVVWAAASVGAVFLGYGLVAVVAAQLCAVALNCVFLAFLIHRLAGGLPRPGLDRRLLRAMGSFGVLVFAGSVAYQWMINGPPALLATLVSSSELTTFMIPHLALQKLAPLVAAASLAFFPAAAMSSAINDRLRLGALLRSHLRLSFLAAAFICGYLAVFARPLLAVWISPEFAAGAAPVMQPLVLVALVLAPSAPVADVARAAGHPSWVLAYTATVAALGGLATLALAPSGLPAVAWGVFVAFLGPSIVLAPIVAGRLGGLTLGDLLRAMRCPVVAALIVWAAFGTLSRLTSDPFGVLGGGFLLGLAYAAGVARWALDAAERRVFMGLFDRKAWRP